MNNFITRWALAAVLLAHSTSCVSTLDLEYAYRLKQKNTDEHLVLVDKDFKFRFQPTVTGVFFTLENLSDKPAYIDWDNCFFVEPNGNTFNALNTDILNESDEVSSRTANTTAHRTQVPRRSIVKRFTTSTVNAREQNLVTIKEIGSMLSTTNVQWNKKLAGWKWVGTAQSTTNSSYASTLTVSSVDSWYARRYWTQTVDMKPGDDVEAASLKAISDFLLDNPSMAFGLRVLHGDEVLDFRFDFLVEAVFASNLQKSPGPIVTERRRKLLYSAYAKDDWKWKGHEDG